MLGLRTAVYKVSDLKEAKNWYSDVFQVAPYFEEDFYIGFNIGGYELGLLPEEKSSKKSESVLTYWGVDNIVDEYNRIIQLGASNHEAPNNVGGELMVASLYDPWNNILGLIYNPYFKIKDPT